MGFLTAREIFPCDVWFQLNRMARWPFTPGSCGPLIFSPWVGWGHLFISEHVKGSQLGGASDTQQEWMLPGAGQHCYQELLSSESPRCQGRLPDYMWFVQFTGASSAKPTCGQQGTWALGKPAGLWALCPWVWPHGPGASALGEHACRAPYFLFPNCVTLWMIIHTDARVHTLVYLKNH